MQLEGALRSALAPRLGASSTLKTRLGDTRRSRTREVAGTGEAQGRTFGASGGGDGVHNSFGSGVQCCAPTGHRPLDALCWRASEAAVLLILLVARAADLNPDVEHDESQGGWTGCVTWMSDAQVSCHTPDWGTFRK